LFLFIVLAEDVADVLAQKAFNALPEFLNPIHVLLIYLPFHAGARLKRRDFLIHLVIPGNVRH
jgi:hypothetical protein